MGGLEAKDTAIECSSIVQHSRGFLEYTMLECLV